MNQRRLLQIAQALPPSVYDIIISGRPRPTQAGPNPRKGSHVAFSVHQSEYNDCAEALERCGILLTTITTPAQYKEKAGYLRAIARHVEDLPENKPND